MGEREDGGQCYRENYFVEAIFLTFVFRYFSHFSATRKMASLNKTLANGETGRGECEETKYTGQPTKPFFTGDKVGNVGRK